MWIKTKGGDLLNMEYVEYVDYNRELRCTIAHARILTHAIADFDCTDTIADNIRRGTKVMEVQ